MDLDLQHYADACRRWAATKPEVGEVWLFGSRVRGGLRSESDLDVAVIMCDASQPPAARLATWISLSSQWLSDLQKLLPIKLDLQLGDADLSTEVVAPELKSEGMKIYPI